MPFYFTVTFSLSVIIRHSPSLSVTPATVLHSPSFSSLSVTLRHSPSLSATVRQCPPLSPTVRHCPSPCATLRLDLNRNLSESESEFRVNVTVFQIDLTLSLREMTWVNSCDQHTFYPRSYLLSEDEKDAIKGRLLSCKRPHSLFLYYCFLL